MKFRDVVTSHLREDTRILASVLAMRRIYSDPMYEIFLCVYSGLTDSVSLNDDLVTCLIVFKDENLRLMFKLWTDEIRVERNAYIETAVAKLVAAKRGPMHLVKDAKTWCHIPFTLRDRAALRLNGLDLPKPPKEFWKD